jgi:hypothetical protein
MNAHCRTWGINAVAFCLASAFLGCQGDPTPRSYTLTLPKPLKPQTNPIPINTSPVELDVTWEKPESWMVKETSGGFRVASLGIPSPGMEFTGELDPNHVDVSLVKLAGNAGGLEANIARWMEQVKIPSPIAKISQLLQNADSVSLASGHRGIIIDLTAELSGDMTETRSIYGAIVVGPTFTVFVKATGDKAQVIERREIIKTFTESLRLTKPEAP